MVKERSRWMRVRENVGREEGQIKGRQEERERQKWRMRERESLNVKQTDRKGETGKKNREKEPLGARIIRPLPPSGAAENGRG